MESIWLVQAIGLFIRFMTMIPEKHLREEYQRRTLAVPQAPPEPGDALTTSSRWPSTTTPTRWPSRWSRGHAGLQLILSQIEFIQNSRIAFSMSGMLGAIPKTPLYDRLASGSGGSSKSIADPDFSFLM